MTEIDPEGARPIYLQLADILRAQIASGDIPPNRPIPSKRALTQRYGVSRGSCDHAIAVLKAEGLIHTVAGRGLFVVGPERRASL
jgi:DNA-binding GntR family transcriptional regulator